MEAGLLRNMSIETLRRLIAHGVAVICLLHGGSAIASDLLYFSTLGNTGVPGVPEPFDDADIYRFDGDTGQYDRVFDGRNAGLPVNADIDALYVVDPVTFILSFRADAGTVVPGLGTVTAGHEVINLAENALTTVSYRPDGSSPLPDPNHNITRALELNPDMIIMNFPSHNVAEGIPTAATIAHYQEMKAAAEFLGVPLFLTTTQPCNFGTLAKRTELRDEAIAVRTTFGAIVIDIYDELTNFNSLRLKAVYNSGDGTHLNDAGHDYVFETTRDKISTLVTP
jgi:hypothetical protein